MNSRMTRRNARTVRLLTVLLPLALIVGIAPVAQAQEISSQEKSSMVITAKQPVYADFSSTIRDETRIAIWMTRIDVGTNLGMKLGRPNRKYLVATTEKHKRG